MRARTLLRLAGHLERHVSVIGRGAGWLMPLLVLVIVADVVLRHWFVIGSTRLQELEWHLHGALFLLSLGYAFLRGAHVRIELVHDRLSPRAKAMVELCGLLLALLPWCAAMLWFGADYAGRALLVGEASSSPGGLPMRWIIKSVLVAGIVLLALAGFARLIRAAVFLFGPPELAQATGFARGEMATSHGEEQRT